MSSEELQKAVEESMKERVVSCEKELAEVLKKYNCTLDISHVSKMNGSSYFNVDIIPAELTKQG